MVSNTGGHTLKEKVVVSLPFQRLGSVFKLEVVLEVPRQEKTYNQIAD
jgi:hypothetical protein